jgi:hypothetical protein
MVKWMYFRSIKLPLNLLRRNVREPDQFDELTGRSAYRFGRQDRLATRWPRLYGSELLTGGAGLATCRGTANALAVRPPAATS